MNIVELSVLNPGIFSTIQDKGRDDWASYGVPFSGPFDKTSMWLANWLVGNSRDAPVMECTGPGFEFVTTGEGTLAISGAEGDWFMNEEPIHINKSIYLSGQNHFKLKSLYHGYRSYIGIHGSMDVPIWLGSSSPLKVSSDFIPSSNFLRKGSKIKIETKKPFEYRQLPEELEYHFAEKHIIRFINGPEYPYFHQSEIFLFTSETYQISTTSDRMGLQLEGVFIDIRDMPEMISSGILSGTIQINNKGLPMILGPDAQTIGGYPRIGVVARIDFDKLGQLSPGDTVTFKHISLEEGHRLYEYRQERMDYLLGIQ